VLAVGCGFLLLSARQLAMPLVAPLSTLPQTVQGFTGRDIEVPPEQRAIAGMSSYVMRIFQKPAPSGTSAFSVYVGYYESQIQGKSIHSPKNCLPGNGWEPISAGTTAIPVGAGAVQVNRYLLGKESQTALVYYWYQGRGRIAANEYKVKWNLLQDKALRGRSEETLVRIVVPYTGSAAAADSLATSVAAELMPQIEAHLPPYPGRSALKS
jgi:EpsI family protein